MSRKYPIAYNEGRLGHPLTTYNNDTPHEKGERRKTYEQGRCKGRLDDIEGLLHYARIDNLQVIERELEALYVKLIGDMFEHDDAVKLLHNMKEQRKRPR